MHSYRMDKSCQRTLILTSWYLPGIMLSYFTARFLFSLFGSANSIPTWCWSWCCFSPFAHKASGKLWEKVSSRLGIPNGLYENYSFDWWKYSSYITQLLSMMHLQRPAWILPEVNGKQSARTMALEWLDVFCNSFTDQYGLAGERLYTYTKFYD